MRLAEPASSRRDAGRRPGPLGCITAGTVPFCDENGTVPVCLDPDLAADFLALGYCHLQVELLTRKLRYMSNLDETSLQTAVLAAAGEACRGDAAAAREHLQSAFDRLHEAREYYYPVDARLLDLTLLAPSTFGDALRTSWPADCRATCWLRAR